MTAGQKRILVVDDDPIIRDLLVKILTMQELAVDVAEGGARAVELLGQHHYSVVLLDLMMPGVDGFSILDRIGGGEIVSPPVVLVVTAADRATIDRLDAQRIHGVIRKPFDPDEIARLVVACAEIKSRSPFGPMAIATLVAGGPLLAFLHRLP